VFISTALPVPIDFMWRTAHWCFFSSCAILWWYDFSCILLAISSGVQLTRRWCWNLNFFTATGMHNMDYAVARCLSVCSSVCLSVCHTPVFCQTITHILKVFSQSGSLTILVSPHFRVWKTKKNVHRIGILLPVSISAISP